MNPAFNTRVVSPGYLRLAVLLGVLAVGLPVLAQLGTGQIEGAVLDPSGAVIPDAQVTVRNTATGVERSLTSDSAGRYRAIDLQPGIYSVKAEKSGFRSVERTGIEVTVGSTTTADIRLEVAAVAETVTVTEAAPVVDVEKTDVTSTISDTVVTNVPVIGRRWDNYVLLTPGVSPDGTFGLITYRGVSGLYNNNTVDGADNNQAFFSEARGRTRVVYTISQAAVKEFQVGFSNFNAEYGRAAGGLVNSVTKSGTNAFHGEAFYFLRDDITSAREPTIPTDVLERAIGKEKLPERRQQFGFAMGGAVVTDKLFWFLNYDQQVRTFPYVVNTSSASFPASNCTSLTNANQVATCLFFEQERTVVGRKGHNNVALGRLDWQANSDNNVTFYYNFHKWRSPNGIRTPLINFNAATDNGFDGVRTDIVYARWNSVITPQLINEFRFQFGRDNEFQRPNGPGPSTTVTGGFTFGMPNFLPRPAFPNEKRFQFVDNVSVIRGPHTFKLGFDINYVREKQINLFQGGGVYSYSSFANLAGDCPLGARVFGCVPDGSPSYGSFTQAFDVRVVNGQLPIDQAGSISFTTTDWNFYAQDTFKLTPSVTLNYGLRYEFQDIPQPPQGNPLLPLTQRINQDKNNFGPRFGLAWDIGARHKTVLRAGYGLIYGRTSNSAISSAMTDNGVVIATLRFFTSTAGRPLYPDCFIPGINTPCTLPTPSLTGPTAQVPDTFQFSEDFARPFIHQWELSLEHEVFSNTTVSATYAFSGGRRLPIFRDVNLPPPGNSVFINLTAPLVLNGETVVPAGVSGPFPFYCVGNASGSNSPAGSCPATSVRPISGVRRIMQADSVGDSSYNGLILRLQRRMSRGVMFNTHFTWSHSIDDGQNSLTFFGRSSTAFDPLDRRGSRSDSDFDVRKRFVTTFVWQPDRTWEISEGVAKKVFGDWTFSGVFTAQDGRPIDSNLSGFLSSSCSAASAICPIDTGNANGSGGDFRAPFIGRNVFDGFGFANFDFRISRSFRFGESKRVELIAESFNLFNRVNFTSVDTTAFRLVTSGALAPTDNVTSCGGVPITLGNRCLNVNPATGYRDPRAASSTLNTPREWQFAIKFFW